MTEVAASEFRFGEGKISGILSATLGTLGFGAVLCLLYPQWLTSADMRALYPMGLVRALIQFVLAAAFALGALNTILNRRPRSAGMAGMLLSVIATALCAKPSAAQRLSAFAATRRRRSLRASDDASAPARAASLRLASNPGKGSFCASCS